MQWLAGDASRRAELEDALARFGRGDVVDWLRRRATRRQLARVALPGGDSCFVKHYLAGDRHPSRDRWKRWLGLSTAEREWRTGVRLRAAGLAVPAPLAHARLDSGEHVVATEWIDGVPLADALARGPGPRRRLLAQLGGLVRQLHTAGWCHRDLHRENILVSGQGPVLIDLQAALPVAPAAARRRDLGELDASLRRELSIGDRVRLRAAALGLERPFGPGARAALRGVGRSSLARVRAHARSRARRSLRAGRRARELVLDGGRGLVSRAVDEAPVRALLAGEAGSPGLELRDYPGRWSDLWRGSAARRAWHTAHALEASGVRCVAPVAFLEWRRGGLPGRSALVTARPEPVPASAGERADALLGLGLRLHEAGFDVTRLDPGGVALERHAGRIEATVTAPEALRFPVRPDPHALHTSLARLEAAAGAGEPGGRGSYRRRWALAQARPRGAPGAQAARTVTQR